MDLTQSQETVLRYLFEHKGDEPSKEDIATGTRLSIDVVASTLNELQEFGMVSGTRTLLDEATEALGAADDNLKPTVRGYPEHLLLIASALSKADEKFLARELHYDLEFVNVVGARLRASGIWVNSQLSDARRSAWDDAVAFFLDGAVASGDLMVVGGPSDDPQYQMTEQGKTRAANLIKNAGN